MLSDHELDQVAPFVAQMIEDRLRERLGWIVAASGLNVGETDGAQDGELRASGAVRTRSGISMGGAELSAPAGVLAGIQIATPAVSPTSGARFIYPKSDGWYEKNSAGVESKLITSAHTHDDRYYTEGELNTSGAGGQVHWNNVTNVGIWTDYSASSTVLGWSAFSIKQIYTKKIGKTVFCSFYIDGTSNAATASFTVPYTAAALPSYFQNYCRGVDNGVVQLDPSYANLPASSGTVGLLRLSTGAGWTAAGQKVVIGQFFYEANA